MILPCEQLDPQGRSLEELKKIQLDTASQVSLTDSFEPLKNIAGADCSYIQDKVIAVIIVQDAHTFEILEQKHIIQPVKMPYVSTYLSFREGYPLCCAFHDLRTKPDLMLVDGCGISPQRCWDCSTSWSCTGHSNHWHFQKNSLRKSLRTDL